MNAVISDTPCIWVQNMVLRAVILYIENVKMVAIDRLTQNPYKIYMTC